MNCKESLELMNEYFDHEINESRIAELFQHLAGCNACRTEFKNLMDLRHVFRTTEPVSISVTLDRRIEQLAKAHTAVPPKKNFAVFELFTKKLTIPIPAFAMIVIFFVLGSVYISSKYFFSQHKAETEYVYVMQLPEMEVHAKF